MTEPKYPTFLTIKQVSEILKLDQRTVRNFINEGIIPAHRFGKQYRISKNDLTQFIKAGRVNG